MLGSSERRLATAQPPEPPPTTTKSKVSVTCSPHYLLFCTSFRIRCFASSRNGGFKILGHESQQLLQPRDFGAVRRIEIGKPVERRAIEHRLQLAARVKTA